VLMERLVRAQEQERSRVAADLHDDTIQVMSACVISLDSLRLAMQDGNVERATAGLKQVADLISGAVERPRRMTFELRPAVLWHHGLVTAVEQSLDTLEREIGVMSSLEVTGMEARIDATMPQAARTTSERGRLGPMLTVVTTFSFLGSNSRATRPSQPSVPTLIGSQVCQMSIARKCDRGESLKPTPCRMASFLSSQNGFSGAM